MQLDAIARGILLQPGGIRTVTAHTFKRERLLA